LNHISQSTVPKNKAVADLFTFKGCSSAMARYPSTKIIAITVRIIVG